jgi:hypothetical protein
MHRLLIDEWDRSRGSLANVRQPIGGRRELAHQSRPKQSCQTWRETGGKSGGGFMGESSAVSRAEVPVAKVRKERVDVRMRSAICPLPSDVDLLSTRCSRSQRDDDGQLLPFPQPDLESLLPRLLDRTDPSYLLAFLRRTSLLFPVPRRPLGSRPSRRYQQGREMDNDRGGRQSCQGVGGPGARQSAQVLEQSVRFFLARTG